MSRNIKFRFWIEKYKRMCDWDTALKEKGYLHLLNFPEWIPMQFTGLLDKNGKEIYEGDIVKFDGHTFEDKFIAIIVFNNGMFRPEQWNEPLGNYKYLEIIGNVYENKDLLNETK